MFTNYTKLMFTNYCKLGKFQHFVIFVVVDSNKQEKSLMANSDKGCLPCKNEALVSDLPPG